MAYFTQQELSAIKNSQPQAKQPAKPQKPKGRGGFITSLISEAGGTGGALGGAALGTALLPGVGTVIGAGLGGLLGGTGGRIAENKVRDDRIGLGDALKEGAISGVAGAGPLKLAKAGIGATKGAAKGTGAVEGANNAIGTSIFDKLTGNRLSKTGQALDAEASGIERGTTLRGGRMVTPEYEGELLDFMRNRSKEYVDKGIKAGKSRSQSDSAQAVFKNVSSKLDDALNSINREAGEGDKLNITSNIANRVAEDAGVTGTTKTMDKFALKVNKAKDLKELEKIRREADDIAFTSDRAGKTSAARQARHVRDAIDEFITPESDDYKAIKGDYQLAKDALELTTKASKSNTKSLKNSQNIAGAALGGSSAQGAKSATGGFLNRMARQSTDVGAVPSARNFATRILGGATLTRPLPEDSSSELFTEEPADTSAPATIGGQAVATTPEDIMAAGATDDTDPYSPVNVQATVKSILAQGGTQKDVAEYLANAKAISGLTSTSGEKPLSAEASKVIANANSGLSSLDKLESLINEGGVPKGTLIPGRSLFGGIIGNSAGTANYDAINRNISDVITRLRTGAALTEQEARFYSSQLPQAFDDAATVQNKLDTFRELFSSVANRTGSSGTDLTQAAGL